MFRVHWGESGPPKVLDTCSADDSRATPSVDVIDLVVNIHTLGRQRPGQSLQLGGRLQGRVPAARRVIKCGQRCNTYPPGIGGTTATLSPSASWRPNASSGGTCRPLTTTLTSRRSWKNRRCANRGT